MEELRQTEPPPFPPTRGVGWLPIAMLGYLAFFFIPPITDGAGPLQWAATIAAGLVFVALYFAAYAVHGWRQLAIVGVIVAMGLAFVPTNAAALVFFIYAGLFIPHGRGPRLALVLLAALAVVVAFQAWLLGYPVGYWFPAILCPSVAGIVNISVVQRQHMFARLRLAQDEVENLAKIAERERIARDLHDVLGHTMSVIILKSELASKLVDRDPERAKAEIGDVERISRNALAEIREAIRGYRSGGLAAEIVRARETLRTAGVAFECESTGVALEPAQETVFALVVREAVTNVVRHANAHRCRLELEQSGGACRLEITDDGRGMGQSEGSGLRGMRERVEGLGGTIERGCDHGTTLTITLPLEPGREAVVR
jgi:two-component system sensor histidine kinase DesK